MKSNAGNNPEIILKINNDFKCPKCHSLNLLVSEKISGVETWYFDENGIGDCMDVSSSVLETCKYWEAKCEICEKQFKIKKPIAISSLNELIALKNAHNS